jgi:hypothetical protein
VLPLADPRVAKKPAYLVVILPARVIPRIDGVAEVTPKVIESLFATDLAHLQTLYNSINGHPDGAPVDVTCPRCAHHFALEPLGAGGPASVGG